MRKRAVVIGLVFAALACIKPRQDQAPVEAELCTVVANARQFDGRWVRMRVRVDSDGREHTRLLDNKCGSRWITVASHAAPGANLRELKGVLFGSESGTLDREVTATIVGRFHANTTPPRHTIDLLTASDISVKRRNPNPNTDASYGTDTPNRTAGDDSTTATKTTVCAIAATPAQFYDRRVTVDGCITTDGIERTVLHDRACPYTGISPGESVKLPADQRFFPEVEKEVCGTFTGVFRAQTGIGGLTVDTNVLEIDETANLRTIAKK
jgi:hypothetical protein